MGLQIYHITNIRSDQNTKARSCHALLKQLMTYYNNHCIENKINTTITTTSCMKQILSIFVIQKK